MKENIGVLLFILSERGEGAVKLSFSSLGNLRVRTAEVQLLDPFLKTGIHVLRIDHLGIDRREIPINLVRQV